MKQTKKEIDLAEIPHEFKRFVDLDDKTKKTVIEFYIKRWLTNKII